MRPRRLIRCTLGSAVWLLLAAGVFWGCGGSSGFVGAQPDNEGGAGAVGGAGAAGGGYVPPCDGGCSAGFVCEANTCVPEDPVGGTPGQGRSTLTSDRYVFSLESSAGRLIRIDSATLEVSAFAAGLAPMVTAVVGTRELTLTLDALDLVEVLDHRESPPRALAWVTARSLSHAVLSTTGEHAVFLYDWDDPRSAERQPEPGNINQVSVLDLHEEHPGEISEEPSRITNVAVAFLPEDVRFSADGTRAVVIGRSGLTPLVLGRAPDVATPQATISFDEGAAEILIDSAAHRAVLRYANSATVEILDLTGGAGACFTAQGTVSDIALDANDQLWILQQVTGGAGLSRHDLTQAATPCAHVSPSVQLPAMTRLALGPELVRAVAYNPTLSVEQVVVIDLVSLDTQTLALEKAVAGVAFAPGGRFVLLSHLKAPGDPLWDPTQEDPAVSVDKSYGVSWVDLETGIHRLAISDVPFGKFTFIPEGSEPGSTLVAVSDSQSPQLLRVTHQPGFNDHWLPLAAFPLEVGYLPQTQRAWVSQEHPWGRLTFMSSAGDDLRHVTGFALEVGQ